MKIKNSNPAFESLDRNKLERMLEIKQLYDSGELPYDEAKRRMQKEELIPYPTSLKLTSADEFEECRWMN